MTGPVLVLGATGLLGRRVAQLAADRGAEVVGTWHRRPPHDASAVAWVCLDVRDPLALETLVRDLGPHLVVNCAYVQGGGDLRAVTAAAPVAAAVACRMVGARLVQLSSDVVFGGRDDRAYVEDDAVDPTDHYGRAKVDAETGVLAVDPTALVVRTSLLYGGDAPGPQEQLVEQALTGADIRFFTDEWRSPVHVDDLAAAVLDLAADETPPGRWHVAGHDGVSRLRFAQLLAAAAGGDPERLAGGPADHSQRRRPGRVVLDSSKAEAHLRRLVPGVESVLGPGR